MSGTDRLTVNAEDMKLHIISTANTTPLAINGDGFWIVKFLHDGTVEFNEKLTPKEGSEEAWRLLQAEARRSSQAAPAPSEKRFMRFSDEQMKAMIESDPDIDIDIPARMSPASSDGLREAAATILAVLQDPDSLPIEKHPDWQAIYNAMTADHNESVEISGDSWHDWPSILIAGLEVMAQDSAALTPAPAQEVKP